MWKRVALVVAVLTMLCLTACGGGQDAPRHGVVIDREHVLPWRQVSIISTGKVTVPIIIFHPESWALELKHGARSGWRDVSRETWALCLKGSWC